MSLNNTLFSQPFSDGEMTVSVLESPASKMGTGGTSVPAPGPTPTSITCETLIAAQSANKSLKKYFANLEGNSPPKPGSVVFLFRIGVLTRRWLPSSGGEFDC